MMTKLPYPFVITSLNFGSKNIRIAMPENPEKLFEELLDKDKHHEDLSDERIPYWGELWPSAMAMAEFIFENPALIKGKKIIEIGCGLGLPGIAAGICGGYVTQTDYMSASVKFATFNWALNLESKPESKKLDWRKPGKTTSFDVLLASDVAYENRSFKPVISAMKSLTRKDGLIILSEPNRSFARSFINELESKEFKTERHEKKIIKDKINYRVSIYVIQRNPN